jgi:hypothetical protein
MADYSNRSLIIIIARQISPQSSGSSVAPSADCASKCFATGCLGCSCTHQQHDWPCELPAHSADRCYSSIPGGTGPRNLNHH